MQPHHLFITALFLVSEMTAFANGTTLVADSGNWALG
jgi:hypothetical protein